MVSSVAISTMGLISSRTGVCFGSRPLKANLLKDVAFGKHAGNNAFVIDHRDRAYLVVDHQLNRFGHIRQNRHG